MNAMTSIAPEVASSGAPVPLAIAADGARLAGRIYLPAGGKAPRAAVVLHGAVGVPQGFYRAFASWAAAERDLAVLTYDYRDFGASAHGPVRVSRATLADWGLRDQVAATAALAARLPGLPLWALGHSIGGVMLPFHPHVPRLARAITVASGPVHLSDHPWPYRWLAASFWYGHGAAATRLAGYLPGRVSGLGADLPAGVYWQWRRWCTTAGFHMTDAGRALPLPDPRAVTAPVTVIAVADDDVVPPAAVWRLMQMFPEAVKRQRVLRPEGRPIGHIRAFAAEHQSLWPQILD